MSACHAGLLPLIRMSRSKSASGATTIAAGTQAADRCTRHASTEGHFDCITMVIMDSRREYPYVIGVPAFFSRRLAVPALQQVEHCWRLGI